MSANPRIQIRFVETGMTSRNYSKGQTKTFGDEVRVNEFWGLDPADLPRKGDYVILKTRAHELTEVVQSKSKAGTVRYHAIIRRLTEVPKAARRFTAVPNIRNY